MYVQEDVLDENYIIYRVKEMINNGEVVYILEVSKINKFDNNIKEHLPDPVMGEGGFVVYLNDVFCKIISIDLKLGLGRKLFLEAGLDSLGEVDRWFPFEAFVVDVL